MATFQEIYNAAAARYPDGDWNRMAPSDITRAIDEEMHRRDAKGCRWAQQTLPSLRSLKDNVNQLRRLVSSSSATSSGSKRAIRE